MEERRSRETFESTEQETLDEERPIKYCKVEDEEAGFVTSENTLKRLKDLQEQHSIYDSWAQPSNNPHIFSQLVGNDEQRYRKYYSTLNLPLCRIMEDYHPSLPYRRRNDEEKSVIHWGQRKLLLAEIEFLTKYGDLSNNVVYVGAAPGTHTKFLTELFPYHNFYLYDPAPFAANLRGLKNVETHQVLFTDDVAEQWRNSQVLFISDIRSADPDLMEEGEVEDNVISDMNAQMKWCEMIEPVMCSLKFRLPWRKGETEYFDGDIYYQVWGPPTTTETRLISNCKKKKKFNNTSYEQRLFYFNTVVRLGLYYHPYCPAVGIDYCYDCACEIHILSEYFKKFPHMIDILYDDISPRNKNYNEDSNKNNNHNNEVSSEETQSIYYSKLAAVMNEISLMISPNRSLATGNLNPTEKKANISARQFINGAPAYAPQLQKKPVYSSKSIAMMEKMLQKPLDSDTRLGANSSGISAPLSLTANQVTSGLGYLGGKSYIDKRSNNNNRNCSRDKNDIDTKRDSRRDYSKNNNRN